MTDGVPLLDAAAARAGDEAAVAAGATWSGLMERAAGHLARGVVDLAGRGYGLRVAIVVGKGNNGGDGWAAARRLTRLGASVRVVAPHGSDVETTPETAANRQRWIAGGGRVGDADALASTLEWADVAVDALLGTGAAGPLRGPVALGAQALRDAADRGCPIVACDAPTGISADDGSAAEGAVRADLTVTFGGLKRGLLLHPGVGHAGRVVVGELGGAYVAPGSTWAALTAGHAALPPLGRDSDKRARGRLLVVAGSDDLAGAAVFVARGAAEAGVGLLTVAGVPAVVRAVQHAVPAAMTVVLPAHEGAVDPAAVASLRNLVEAADAVVVGPGLGTGKGAAAVAELVRASSRRAVLDADGLNVHRDDPGRLAEHDGDLVLTPHARELARIGGGSDGDEAFAERVERVPELAARYDATVVAKGPGTLVAAPDGRVWVTPTGGPGLGAGGTGDTLAGVIAATVARASDVPLAVARAVWLHGLAGDLAARGAGGRPGSEAVASCVATALQRTRDLATSRPSWPLEVGE